MEGPHPEEEDAFKKYYRHRIRHPPKINRAFHSADHLASPGEFYIITAKTDVQGLLSLSHSKNVSLTESLASIYLFALQEIHMNEIAENHPKRAKPVRLMVPVKLRRLYPSNLFPYHDPSTRPDSTLHSHRQDNIRSSITEFLSQVRPAEMIDFGKKPAILN